MARRIRSAASWLGLVVLALAWAATLRPTALGGPATYLVIRGSSMLPTLETGDLVVLRADSSYSAGDIVGYRVPAGEIGAGRLVLHRIVGGDASGFVVRGDNNSAIDPWTPSGSDVAGRTWLVLPGVGRLVAWLHEPLIAGAIGAAVAVACVVGREAPSSRRRSRTLPAATGRSAATP